MPGLRREELARLAGVSSSYYTRVEQGQLVNASPQVLDALARALQLDDDEHRHLRDLARAQQARRAPGRPPAERAGGAVRGLLAAMPGVPAVLTGRRGDVLAWNGLGHALLAGHEDPAGPDGAPHRPNLARMVFLDPHTRELHVDWPRKARAVVAHLRLVAGRYPDDQLLSGLIGELATNSPEFAKVWARHTVGACDGGVHELRHPLVGALTVTQQNLQVAGHPDQTLATFTCTPGSPSHAALRLLEQEVGDLRPGA